MARHKQQETLSVAQEQKKKVSQTDNFKLTSLQRENELFQKRILEKTNTFFTQAQFFGSLLTLNEIQLIQSFVESAAHFLNANQVSYYQYNSKENHFTKSASYHRSKGLKIDYNGSINDRLLLLIRESRSVLSIREILHNEMLHKIWKSSESKALIYCPIFYENHFFGILAIDEIKFFHLNRETIKDAGIVAKLSALAIKNIKLHQRSISEKKIVQSKQLTEYQQFLKALNYEFKRAGRGELPLSLILIVLENRNHKNKLDDKGILLAQRIKKSCQKNLRDIDLNFGGDTPGTFWAILPITDFSGLAYVMERLNLVLNMDLAGQSNYLCHFGFSSLDQGIKQPKQMIETCKESFHLHRTVRMLLYNKKEQIKNS